MLFFFLLFSCNSFESIPSVFYAKWFRSFLFRLETIFVWWFLHQWERKKTLTNFTLCAAAKKTFFFCIDRPTNENCGPFRTLPGENDAGDDVFMCTMCAMYVKCMITIACSIVCDCFKKSLCIWIHKLCEQWQNCDWIIMIVFNCFCAIHQHTYTHKKKFILLNAIFWLCMSSKMVLWVFACQNVTNFQGIELFSSICAKVTFNMRAQMKENLWLAGWLHRSIDSQPLLKKKIAKWKRNINKNCVKCG